MGFADGQIGRTNRMEEWIAEISKEIRGTNGLGESMKGLGRPTDRIE
jgi:hypothetical protein